MPRHGMIPYLYFCNYTYVDGNRKAFIKTSAERLNIENRFVSVYGLKIGQFHWVAGSTILAYFRLRIQLCTHKPHMSKMCLAAGY